MRQTWYGPLVELGDMERNKGGHVQLLVFVLHSTTPQRIRTLKGNEALRSIIYVGDSSRSNIKVMLWNYTALGHNISAGEIVFMQNMKIIEFRGQLELTSVQVSMVMPMMNRQAILSCRGTEEAGQCGPLVEERTKHVLAWARKTQWTLISFLDHISRIMKTLPNKSSCDSKESSICKKEVKKCSCILDILSCQEDCTVEFDATIREIFLPYDVKRRNKIHVPSHCDYLFFSKHLQGERAQDLLKELVSHGCEEDDDNDVRANVDHQHCSNHAYGAVISTTKNQGCRIFKPFYVKIIVVQPSNRRHADHREAPIRCVTVVIFFQLYVGDSSGQTTLLVRHEAALQLFADISPDTVLECLQANIRENDGDGEHENTRYDLILLILIRALLSQKNGPMRIRAEFRGAMAGALGQLDVVSIGLPLSPYLK